MEGNTNLDARFPTCINCLDCWFYSGQSFRMRSDCRIEEVVLHVHDDESRQLGRDSDECLFRAGNGGNGQRLGFGFVGKIPRSFGPRVVPLIGGRTESEVV